MLSDTSSLAVDKVNRIKLKLRIRCNNSTICSEIPVINVHLKFE